MPTETTLSDEVRSLSLIPILKQRDTVELEKLAELMEQVSFKAGQVVFHKHDPGDALYIVESGTLRLWVLDEDAKQVTLAELQAGDFTGEIAVLDNGERSANETALTDTVLHKLRSDHFQEFLMQHPVIAVDVIRVIGRRMRQTNLLVSQRISRNVNVEMEQKATIGQRIADRVASFGGSWTFIIIYGTTLACWMALNSFVLSHYGKGEAGAQFDPYPYILLNLMLSMTAAMQAPIIMMSQNRSAEKDRLAAEQDFHVNLKSELLLEELIRRDDERADQMNELLHPQKQQLASSASNDGAQIS